MTSINNRVGSAGSFGAGSVDPRASRGAARDVAPRSPRPETGSPVCGSCPGERRSPAQGPGSEGLNQPRVTDYFEKFHVNGKASQPTGQSGIAELIHQGGTQDNPWDGQVSQEERLKELRDQANESMLKLEKLDQELHKKFVDIQKQFVEIKTAWSQVETNGSHSQALPFYEQWVKHLQARVTQHQHKQALQPTVTTGVAKNPDASMQFFTDLVKRQTEEKQSFEEANLLADGLNYLLKVTGEMIAQHSKTVTPSADSTAAVVTNGHDAGLTPSAVWRSVLLRIEKNAKISRDPTNPSGGVQDNAAAKFWYPKLLQRALP